MTTRVKICGFTAAADIKVAVECGVDAIGLVFYPQSPRFVSLSTAQQLSQVIPPFVTTVGLFVNATVTEVAAILSLTSLDILQFHGDETVDDCHRIAEQVKRPYIRAMRVHLDTKPEDLLQCEIKHRRSPWFKGLLLDSFTPAFGGSGEIFNWSIVPKELGPRVVLSGGLTALNVSDAIEQVAPFAVDVSSGVELSKGIKDTHKMRDFMRAVKTC